MTHEGRMSRGAEKLSKGIKDYETEYYLSHKETKEVVAEVPKAKPKKEKKING